jgi:hypothetical protein
MAPLWALAEREVARMKDNIRAFAADIECNGLEDKRNDLKVSSERFHCYILLNPEDYKKLYWMFGGGVTKV